MMGFGIKNLKIYKPVDHFLQVLPENVYLSKCVTPEKSTELATEMNVV